MYAWWCLIQFCPKEDKLAIHVIRPQSPRSVEEAGSAQSFLQAFADLFFTFNVDLRMDGVRNSRQQTVTPVENCVGSREVTRALRKGRFFAAVIMKRQSKAQKPAGERNDTTLRGLRTHLAGPLH